MRRRQGEARRGGYVPPKFREKYFSGNYHVKFEHFPLKYRVKFGNFVNFRNIFSGKNALPMHLE